MITLGLHHGNRIDGLFQEEGDERLYGQQDPVLSF